MTVVADEARNGTSTPISAAADAVSVRCVGRVDADARIGRLGGPIRSIVAGCLLLSIMLGTPPTAEGQTATLSSASEPESTEAANLYVMRALENIVVTWKSPSADAQSMGLWTFRTRLHLNKLRNVAINYGLERSVLDAIDQTLDLLVLYEGFLKDVVYFDLIAGVARPELKDFEAIAADGIASVVEGAAAGTSLGGLIGTVTVPGLGSVAGAAVGAGIGAVFIGGGRFVSDILAYDNALRRNQQIDQLTLAAKLGLAENLVRQYTLTYRSLADIAAILGGERRFGWGATVGFDGSMGKSIEEQLELRPNDPFLHAARGADLAKFDPAAAAEAFLKAAESIPADFDSGVDIFDLGRAEYLIMSARLCERVAIESGDLGMARRAVARFEDAKRTLTTADREWPREAKLSYVRALSAARHSLASAGIDAIEAEVSESRDTGYESAFVEYELACAESVRGDQGAAMERLRKSHELRPRWDPLPLTDPRLARLREKVGTESIRMMFANPLVGTWATGDYVLEFRLDGSIRQSGNGEATTGAYECSPNGSLTVRMPRRTTEFEYRVSNESNGSRTLALIREGNTTRLTEQSRSSFGQLFGEWRFRDLQVLNLDSSNGDWNKTDRPASSDDELKMFGVDYRTSGKYALFDDADEAGAYRLVLRQPMGVEETRIREFVVRMRNGSLEVRRPGEPNDWGRYSR